MSGGMLECTGSMLDCVRLFPLYFSFCSTFLENFHDRQNINSIKKLLTSWIQTYNLLNASQLLYPLSHTAVVFDVMLLKFSPLLHLQPAAECNLITAFTRSDKLEVGG